MESFDTGAASDSSPAGGSAVLWSIPLSAALVGFPSGLAGTLPFSPSGLHWACSSRS
eukprot:CAMPEP_0195100760 /NCGR_PEP_ID=MMETSP0448-20130528/64717_1 /TAXON_ID=66468 /ORGANISM="Heterocapsa triquestra, Strain CCMP 448" /LENGTH=56 /DNA_ID=CAMNT_0040135973 /DNA_START=123 /DNA_END=293 /DNA_ORIENTATION=+